MKLFLCLFMSFNLYSAQKQDIPRSQPIDIPKRPKKVIRINKKFLKRYKIFKQLREKARNDKQEKTK